MCRLLLGCPIDNSMLLLDLFVFLLLHLLYYLYNFLVCNLFLYMCIGFLVLQLRLYLYSGQNLHILFHFYNLLLLLLIYLSLLLVNGKVVDVDSLAAVRLSAFPKLVLYIPLISFRIFSQLT